MSEVTNETEAKPGEPGPATTTDVANAKPERKKVREALTLVKRHPLGVFVALGVAAALVEIELAVGILTGIGATALLATKSGPEARQDVITKGQEVLTKGKAALDRARVALASRGKTQSELAAAPAASQPESPPAATT